MRIAGNAMRGTAAAHVVGASRSPRTAATGMPAAARKRFSGRRSWAMAIACGDGCTATSAASRASAAAGGFSNSVVTTAHSAAIRASASAVVVRGDEVDVGHRGGRRARVRFEDHRPVAHRRAGARSTRPSWPPPRMPRVAGGTITSRRRSQCRSRRWWQHARAAASRCAPRNSVSASASAGSSSASIATANSAGVRRTGLADGERRHRDPARASGRSSTASPARRGGGWPRARRAPARWSWRRASPAGGQPHRHRR